MPTLAQRTHAYNVKLEALIRSINGAPLLGWARELAGCWERHREAGACTGPDCPYCTAREFSEQLRWLDAEKAALELELAVALGGRVETVQ